MSSNKQIEFLFKTVIKYKKIIKKLRSDLDIEKLKNQDCTCQNNFPQHIFKDDGLICIKVKNVMTSFSIISKFQCLQENPGNQVCSF